MSPPALVNLSLDWSPRNSGFQYNICISKLNKIWIIDENIMTHLIRLGRRFPVNLLGIGGQRFSLVRRVIKLLKFKKMFLCTKIKKCPKTYVLGLRGKFKTCHILKLIGFEFLPNTFSSSSDINAPRRPHPRLYPMRFASSSWPRAAPQLFQATTSSETTSLGLATWGPDTSAASIAAMARCNNAATSGCEHLSRCLDGIGSGPNAASSHHKHLCSYALLSSIQKGWMGFERNC